MKRPRGGLLTGGALVSASAAAALVVGVRTLVTFDLPLPAPLLALEPIPREGLGISWSPGASWPVDIQAAALGRTAALLLTLALAALSVASLNALILLAEGAAARRDELAVRASLGATPAQLLRLVLSELRTLLAAGLTLGLVLGLAAGGALRLAWPGRALPLGALVTSGSLATSLLALSGLLGVAHAAAAWRAATSEELSTTLRAGARATADARAIFVRRLLPAAQAGLGGAVLVAGLTLASAERGSSAASDDGSDHVVLTATARGPGAWSRLLERLSGVPGLEAESLATPGAVVGLGIRDLALAQCGQCFRGTVYTPILPARPDHHAVAPGFFEAAGIALLAGRGIAPGDREGAPRVAVVNQTFAASSFERGDPIGHQIRIGRGSESWYTVVGVVEDRAWPVLGSDERPREAVYLSALQQPPRTADVVLRGSAEAFASAAAVMEELGLSAGEARPLSEARRAAEAPVRWVRILAVALAALAIALAAHGVHVTALQVSRRRVRELAVRRALGASDRGIVGLVIGERARVTGWGCAAMVFVGTLAVALVRRAAGGVPPAGPGTYFGVGALLMAFALTASVRAATEAVRVEPAAAIE